MMKAPSLVTATLLLAVFLCLGSNETVASCDMKICIQDDECNGESVLCNSPNSDCASYAFTAPCTGSYALHSEVVCQTGCDHCNVCVIIQKVPGGTIVGWCSNACGEQYCNANCSVDLVKDENYFLYVCKMPCEFNEDCEDCPSECKARGCICIGISTGPCVP